jgi:EAL domain-containing protein (putative c-di-GMP-specific phosphodiesterase class I)
MGKLLVIQVMDQLANCLAARQLGIGVIAEGIETKAQHDILRELSCGHGQGFLFSAACPAEQIPALARRSFAE